MGTTLHHAMIVIDRDPETASHLADSVQTVFGVHIHHLTTSRDALTLLGLADKARRSGEVPWLVLMELDLPDMGGFGLCRRLRRVRSLLHVPIIATTGSRDGEIIEAAFEAGATDYLAKPFERRELAARVRTALQRVRREDRLRTRGREVTKVARHLMRTNEELRRQICVDGLTGIATRHHFERVAHAEWQRAVRDGSVLSILMVDVDWFHAYNAAHGHLAGDSSLARVAVALAAAMQRPSDLLARYGGEEFIAALPDTDAHGAAVVAERMRVAVEQMAIPHGGDGAGPVVTVTIGAASAMPRVASHFDELLSTADAALLDAKTSGRNRIGGVAAKEVASSSSTAPYPWPLPVEIDPSFAGELPAALRQCRSQVGAIPRSLAAGESARVRSVLRQLRALAQGHHLATADRLCARIEDATRVGDTSSAARAAEELVWYLDRVRVVYRRAPTLVASSR